MSLEKIAIHEPENHKRVLVCEIDTYPELTDLLQTSIKSGTYPTVVVHSSFQTETLIKELRLGPLCLEQCSDGDHAVVQDVSSDLDFSRKGGFFDLHQDGLVNPKVPDFGILYCEDPGEGLNPTVFCDTWEILKTLSDDKHLIETALLLDFVYLDKSGKEQVHPLVETHPLAGRHFINFGSRGFIRQRSVEKAPSIRDISNLLSNLFELADEATYLRHYWQKGDVVLWDNRRLLHGRGGVGRDKARKLVRFVLNRLR